jgi:hypothetical protein
MSVTRSSNRGHTIYCAFTLHRRWPWNKHKNGCSEPQEFRDVLLALIMLRAMI